MQTTLNRVHRNENGINYKSTGTFIEVSPSKNMHSQPTEGAKSLIMGSRLTTGFYLDNQGLTLCFTG